MSEDQTKTPPKSVRYTAYALFLLLILTVVTLAGELYFRNKLEYGRVGYIFSKDLIYHLNPGIVAQKPYAWGKVGKPPFTLTFNKQGFRGKDFTDDPPENTTRILVFGDSYTAGLDYPEDVSFVGQWENLLNNGDEKFEVLNISCPAWGTDQQYLFWEKYGRHLNPDHVVVMMSPNDIRETWNHQIVRYNASADKIEVNNPASKIGLKERLSWGLASKSSLYQMLQKNVFKTDYGNFSRVFWFFPVNYGIEDSTDWDRPLFLREPFEAVNDSYALMERLYRSVDSDCQDIGAKLHLVKIPIRLEIDETYQDSSLFNKQIVEQKITAIATRNNINFINLNEALRNHPNPNDIFMDWEHHYDEDGHNWMAKELKRLLPL
ncbi:MAG: SGNH/GDSL hydrolase family protein [Bacteroidota bacterium]